MIYDFITEDREVLHIKDNAQALHLSAAHTPPSSLLQTHPTLCSEALNHFYRTRSTTLHVDAYAFAKLQNPNDYTLALQRCPYIQNARMLELRLTMNAHVDFLVQAMKLVVPVLLSPGIKVKIVTVTWAEIIHHLLQRTWRPWAYKSPALEPLWDLAGGDVGIVCGGVVNAPRETAEMQVAGMRRTLGMILKYRALSDGLSCP